MKTVYKGSFAKAAALITYVAMLIVNILANILPLNGVTTGEVSEKYSNLFTPAGYTFAIWGVIYLLLAGYVLYSLGLFRGGKRSGHTELIRDINLIFSISSLANIAWIFAWHYDIIPITMIMIVIMLLCLITIYQLIQKEELTPREKLFIQLPFSVYLGWITIATVANAAVFLVSLGWNGFGISEPVWTILILIVAAVIGIVTILKYKDIAFGLVFLWAYVGILVKHLSESGFGGQYPGVIVTTIACLVLFSAAILYCITARKTRR